MCQSCPNSCDQCSNSTTCTICAGRKYLLRGSCIDSCPDGYKIQGATCVPCSSSQECTCPLTYSIDPNGICQKCGSNCDSCQTGDNCATCSNNLILYQGKCLQSLNYDTEVIINYSIKLQTLSALNPGAFATSQEIFVSLKNTTNDTIYWRLYAPLVNPDDSNSSCGNIMQKAQEAASTIDTQDLYNSTQTIFDNTTNTSIAKFTLTGLKPNLLYQITICIQASAEEVEDATINFMTKDNGYQIMKVNLLLDTEIPASSISSFLCELCTQLGVDDDQIIASDGTSCLSSSSNKGRILDSNETYDSIEVYLYGRSDVESDSSVNNMREQLKNADYLSSFSYKTSNGDIYKLIGIVLGGQSQFIQPTIITGAAAQVLESSLLIYNVTVTDTDGFIYFIINQTERNSSESIKQAMLSDLSTSSLISNYSSLGSLQRVGYIQGKPASLLISNHDANKSYVLTYFATNQDTTNNALRTKKQYCYIAGLELPSGNFHSYDSIVFFSSEAAALLLIILIWALLFYRDKLKMIISIKWGFSKKGESTKILEPKMITVGDLSTNEVLMKRKKSNKHEKYVADVNFELIDPKRHASISHSINETPRSII